MTENMISFLVYPGDERPVFDFSNMTEASGNRGVILSGDYWHIKGIEIYKAGDNGLHISGSNNLIGYAKIRSGFQRSRKPIAPTTSVSKSRHLSFLGDRFGDLF